MLDSFPARNPAEPDDPDGYDKALAAALCLHPREVAEDCADPRVGVVQECLSRRALTAGRINDWCTRHGAALREFMERENERAEERRKAAKVAREMHERGEDLSLEERRAVVARFRERLGPNFGLKRMDVVDRARGRTIEDDEAARKARAEQVQREAYERQCGHILADYSRAGLEPVTVGGVPISRELARSLGVTPQEAERDERGAAE